LKTNPDDGKERATSPAPEAATPSAAKKIVIRPGEGLKPARRPFPGPKGTDAALRVAFERRANADLIAHAKESLDREVCGVLAGEICEDDEGLFVHVSAAIRGAAASEGSTHVTFTQATWNAVHRTLERDYPRLRIVGWYHTHPGFGVEFSEMDLFIQQNFFSGPAQIALVTDPLSGAVAIGVNAGPGVEYLARFWVDGREQPCRVPAPGAQGAAAGGPEAGRSDLAQLEARISQLIHAIDEQRAWHHHFLLFCGLVCCVAVILAVGYYTYKNSNQRLEPPQLRQMIPVPIQVGDKTVLLGVGVVEWRVPDELNALLLEEDLLRQEAAEQAAKEAARKQQPEGGEATNTAAGAAKAGAGTTNATRAPARGTNNR
jgi:proteasome lid subunit RPN8/RPN11